VFSYDSDSSLLPIQVILPPSAGPIGGTLGGCSCIDSSWWCRRSISLLWSSLTPIWA
jgi:hypothetical protein